MKKIIVIGGGIAGLSTAQAAREADGEARIHLICGEETLPYYRPRICELFGGLELEKLVVRNHQWFLDNRIEVVNGWVSAVNTAEKQVKFKDGSHLAYDVLVLATGANGNLPELKGATKENTLAIRTLKDIDHVKSIPGPIAIIGGGLLGLEAAWHLSKAGRPVSIMERGDRLLARQLDEEAGRFFLNIVENAGVRVALNGSAESFDGERLLLADGRAFEAALVSFAAGIRSIITLGQAMGLAIGRAIQVDAQMQTSLAGVYACGDCAEYEGRTAGLWTVSMAQGTIAGKNAAGEAAEYKPEAPPYTMNAMGTRIWSAGVQTEDGLCVKNSAAGNFTKLFFDEAGILAGAILIGDIGQAVALKKALGENLTKAQAELQFLNERG